MSVVPLPRASASPTAALERRLAQVERQLAHMVKTWPEDVGAVVGQATAKALDKAQDEARKIVADEFVRRQPLRYRFVWSATERYAPADVVTDGGCAWICCVETQTGDRPGRSGAWRMLAKSG